MKKILLLFFIMVSVTLTSSAKSARGNIQTIINDSGIPKSYVSISVKNLDNGKTVYALNEKILMHPASVQKALALPAAMDVLGEDYDFSTEIFSREEKGAYLIKLGADPYLTSGDLKSLISVLKKESTQKVYIDDSIVENKDWGEGWQWDDDMNASMPRFNAYNLDGNLIRITVMPANKGETALIINPSKYPLTFLNNVITSDSNKLRVTRDNSISLNALTLKGTIRTPESITIPTNNLRGYFIVKLTNSLGDKNIYLRYPFRNSLKSDSDRQINVITHPISRAENDILKNSNNMAMETVMKLAAGKLYNTSGTDILGIKLFNSFCEKNGIDASEIRMVDASGVSKNNLVNADFVTEYLYKLQDNKTFEYLAKPSEGTLSNRMLPLKDNLRAKTGTLSDISSIAGFLTSKNGKKYAFCIIINDPRTSSQDKKNLEDYIIRELYLN